MNTAPERGASPNQPLPAADSPPERGKRYSVWGGLGRFFHVPGAAWARVIALLAILCGIKLALIFKLAPHLYQIHWRIAANETTGAGRAAFFVFVLLGAAHLYWLSKTCHAAGRATVRRVNLAVLTLGFVFLFLTFHGREMNLLFPILVRVLKWSSLGPYLSLNLFFQPPFLAAWMFIYGLGYYILARTAREHWVLYLTTIFATAYGFCCLQELALYRNELLVLDTLGLISLVFLFRNQLLPFWATAGIPLAGTCFFTGLVLFEFRPAAGASIGYFLGLIGAALLLFGLATLAMPRGIVRARWMMSAFFLFAAFVLLSDNHFPTSENYNHALWVGLEFPRYFLTEIGISLFLLAIAGILGKQRPRVALGVVDAAGLLFVALALIDFRLTGIMGVRLDWNVLALGNSPRMMWRMAQPFLPIVLAGMALLAATYYGLVWWGKRAQTTVARLHPSSGLNKASIGGAVFCFVLMGVMGAFHSLPDKARGHSAIRLAATSPLWKRVTGKTPSPEKFFETAKALGMSFDHGVVVSAAPPRDLNVVVVFMESTFNQHLALFGGKEETQPLLGQYKNRMELFPNFFSCFASSIHARFATFTGLYPIQDYNAFTLERVPVKSIFEIMHDQGYSCSMFYSSFFDFTGFGDFLKQRGLDEMYDANSMPGARSAERVNWGVREEETLGAMRARIQKYAAAQQRFFLTYVPAAPHQPFENVPDRFRKFAAAAPDDYTAHYLNQLLYMDWVITSLVDELRDSGLLDKTLVVITDDHGELLGGNGNPIGHGWLLTPELANAPLIVMDPERPGYRVNRTVGSQVDFLPTLCDRLRIPVPGNQLYQGRSLDCKAEEPGRRAYLNSYQQYAVIANDRLLFGDREKEQGKGCPPVVYSIRNEESKTIFQPESASRIVPLSATAFDHFQESLLKNYSFYARIRSATAQPPVVAAEGTTTH